MISNFRSEKKIPFLSHTQSEAHRPETGSHGLICDTRFPFSYLLVPRSPYLHL